MGHLREALARRELMVAEFYAGRKAWTAAAIRAEYLVSNFPSSASAAPALAIMVRAYRAMGLDDLANDSLRSAADELSAPSRTGLRRAGTGVSAADRGAVPLVLPPVCPRLDGLLVTVSGADPHHCIHRKHEDLPVPDLVGAGSLGDGFDAGFHLVIAVTTSSLSLGRKSTTYSAPRYSSVCPFWRPKPLTSDTVIPVTPSSDRASRTSSSRNGLMMAEIHFMGWTASRQVAGVAGRL